MTTREARRLGDWLHNVSNGVIEPARDGPSLVFVEPVVAFGIHAFDPRRIRLAVYFSLAAAAPAIRDSSDPNEQISTSS